MKQYIEHDLVMLPSKEKISNGLYLYSKIASGCEQSGWWSELKITTSTEKMGDFNWNIKKAQHLYITSNDKIEKGWEGWVYKYDVKGKIFKHFYTENPWYKDAKKIIATTDKSLWEHDDTVPYPKTRPAIPQIPQQFIEYYITEFNKDNIITKINVEYRFLGGTGSGWIYKTNPDNTINIKSVEVKMYNRDEVIKIGKEISKLYNVTDFNKLNKWIEENL